MINEEMHFYVNSQFTFKVDFCTILETPTAVTPDIPRMNMHGLAYRWKVYSLSSYLRLELSPGANLSISFKELEKAVPPDLSSHDDYTFLHYISI